jgi:hypothetical protein
MFVKTLHTTLLLFEDLPQKNENFMTWVTSGGVNTCVSPLHPSQMFSSHMLSILFYGSVSLSLNPVRHFQVYDGLST